MEMYFYTLVAFGIFFALIYRGPVPKSRIVKLKSVADRADEEGKFSCVFMLDDCEEQGYIFAQEKPVLSRDYRLYKNYSPAKINLLCVLKVR